MFFPLEDFAAVIGPDNVSCLAMAGSALRTYAAVLAVAVVAIFAAAPRAQAEQHLWSADDSSGILFVSDAGVDTRWIELPRIQLLAFRDEWYPEAHTLAASQPKLAEERRRC